MASKRQVQPAVDCGSDQRPAAAFGAAGTLRSDHGFLKPDGPEVTMAVSPKHTAAPVADAVI